MTSPPAGISGSYIGVDLGGTHLRAARVDPRGGVLAVERVETAHTGGPAAVTRQIEALVAKVTAADCVAIGVGVPGTIDAESGMVLNLPALSGWNGVPLAPQLRSACGLPVFLENDAKVAAIGEWRAGAGAGFDNFAYITVSTGIGGGIVVDGRLLRGQGGLAGEVGHTYVTDGPEVCACGRTGCWQAVASGVGLGQKAQIALSQHGGSRIAVHAAGMPATAVHVGKAAREGDALALRLLAEQAGWLGIGFANVQHCYASQRIVVGGGVSTLLDLLQPGIEASLKARLLPGFIPAEIRPCALHDDSGLVGAALFAMDEALAAEA